MQTRGGGVSIYRRVPVTDRHIKIKNEVATSLNSTASLKASESGLESLFRKHGRKPRQMPTTAKSQPSSMPLRLVSNGQSTR